MKRLLVTALLFLGCASSRTLTLQSNREAQFTPFNQGPVCTGISCPWTFSRQTCFGLDSSSGYLGFSARTPDGVTLQSPMLKTCEVPSDTTVRFEFPSSPTQQDCRVLVLHHGQVASVLPCPDARSNP